MGNYYSNIKPLTFEKIQRDGLERAKSYGKFQPLTDLWEGVREDNLGVMAVEELLDNTNFQTDENYNPQTDPQLEGYDSIIDQFLFSRSAEETSVMLEDLRYNAQIQKESPFYYLGRILGTILDPSTYFAYQFKAARGAIAFGTAATTEEIIKQNLDPLRADEIVPLVATGGYVLPAILNKFSTPIPNKIIDDAVALDKQWNGKIVPEETTLYRGTGGEGKINIASGNIFDDAIYTTKSKDIAQMYGKNVETVNQALSNPIIIKNDADLIKFFETTGKKYSNYDYVKVSEWARNRYKELRAKDIDPEIALKTIDSEGAKVFGYKYKFSNFYMARPFQDDIDQFRKTIIMPIYNEAKKIAIKKGHDGVDVQIGVNKGGSKVFDEKSPVQINKLINEKKILVDQKFSHDQTIFFNKLRNKADDIIEDGKLVDPNKLDNSPSGVGAAAIETTKRSSPAKRMEGEEFVKSRLGIFGEDGPWTPVFRVVKSSSLTAKKMMGDILDTPLLKIKNTRAQDFTASGSSIETKMRRMRVDEIVAQMEVQNKYLEYISRVQGENAVPKTRIGMALHNKLTPNRLSLDEFSREVSKARILKKHDIPEVDASARIYGDKVYDKLFKDIDELGIRSMPVEKELALWNETLKRIRKKGEGTASFTNPSDKKTTTYSVSEIESFIKDLSELLGRIKSGSKVDNYLNRMYLKDAIKSNQPRFREIIMNNNLRQKITMNNKALNELVDDLSNYFPFKRFEKTPWKKWLEEWEVYGKGGIKELDEFLAHKRFIFNKDRYARSLRARTLNLDAQAQIELLEEGFIMGDIFQLGKSYSRQMIPDILLTRKFGDPNGKGYKYISEADSMTEPGLLTVANEYAMKLVGKKGAARVKIIKERDQVLSDLEAGIELVRGTYGLPSDPHAWHSTALRTMKHYNTLTMLTGFMAAIPDAARIVMTSGVKRGFRTQFDLLGDFLGDGNLFKLGKKEAQSAGEAWDMQTGMRAALMGDIGDMFGVANKIEKGMGKAAHFNFMYINMMSRWTEFAKSLASVTIGSRILEDSIAWGKGGLTDKWKTALASSGIDEQMAKRIAKQFDEHGTKTKHNHMANTAEWTDDLARDAFRDALNKDINIAIVTPGLGDTPKWMSTEYGSVFSQFKKFAMGAQQRMLLRGMQERDMDFLFGSMMLMGSGMIIDGMYHKTRFQRDYSKLSLTQKLLNAFDRSGLGGIYTDINKAIETLTDNRIGISPMLGESKPYGSSMRWKAGTLGGPTGGQLYNIADILFDVAGNKYNHHTAKNVRRLIPLQNVWYTDSLFDNLEQGLRFK